jgi:dolichol kinase
MTGNNSQGNQISFAQELARKATHMGALGVPCGYYLLELQRLQMLCILIPVTLAMILIDVARLRDWNLWRSFASRIIGRIIRAHELAGDFTGATYILLSFCLTIGFFDKPLAIAALAFTIVGDTFAAIVGRKFGRHRFRNKSVEGSLGCLVGTVIVALLVPDLALIIGLAGAVVATVVEAVSFRIDDNISVPLVSGLAMTLLTRIL